MSIFLNYDLHDYADKRGIKRNIALYNVSGHVTPRRDGGYWTEMPEIEYKASEPDGRIILDENQKDDQSITKPVITVSGKTPKSASDSGSSSVFSPSRPTIEENGEITATPIEPDEPASAETLDTLLDELNGLVGLDKVKRDVQSLLLFEQSSIQFFLHGFYISTPVGHYNPDWAIAFYEGNIKHIYFVAETKGSMNSMQLRLIEESKIHCAREHFKAISNGNVIYDVVDSYEALLQKVMH